MSCAQQPTATNRARTPPAPLKNNHSLAAVVMAIAAAVVLAIAAAALMAIVAAASCVAMVASMESPVTRRPCSE